MIRKTPDGVGPDCLELFVADSPKILDRKMHTGEKIKYCHID